MEAAELFPARCMPLVGFAFSGGIYDTSNFPFLDVFPYFLLGLVGCAWNSCFLTRISESPESLYYWILVLGKEPCRTIFPSHQGGESEHKPSHIDKVISPSQAVDVLIRPHVQEEKCHA
jgi:hypothetical protein